MKRIFLLKGLDCPNCSAKIEKEVGELDGVQSSVVNLMKQTLTINVAPAAANTIASQIETIVHSHEPDVEVSEIAQEYYIPAKKQDTNTSYNNEDKKLTVRLATGAAIYAIGMALTVFAKVPLPIELAFLIVSYCPYYVSEHPKIILFEFASRCSQSHALPHGKSNLQ